MHNQSEYCEGSGPPSFLATCSRPPHVLFILALHLGKRLFFPHQPVCFQTKSHSFGLELACVWDTVVGFL